ncbi:LacI family DNA-binding transcriptional regulator [Saccharopolyspora tripterygii]
MSSRVTLSDVASRAGLSVTAASLILNGRAGTGLSEDAHRRVFAAAEELGYRPNLMARGLRTEKSLTIGFVSDRVASTRYAGPMIRGALRAARERDHTMFVTETEGEPAEQDRALEALLDRRVDALVIATVTGHASLPERRPTVPVVLLNGVSPDGDCAAVLPDETDGARQAARHLLDLGHRRVHLLGIPAESDLRARATVQVRRRVESLCSNLQEGGAEVVRVELDSMSWDAESGYEAAGRALAGSAPVNAVVALNDAIAAGAYEAFREARVSIPDDVSIVSFDDDEIVNFLRPGLTTVALPFEEMGRRAVELALSEVEPGEYLEPMRLQVRGSTKRSA